MDDAVAITGIGVVSPLSPEGGAEAFFAALCDGASAVREIRSFDASRYPCRVAAEIPREALGGADPGKDPALRMAETAFRSALADAGTVASAWDPRRAGIVVGTVLGGILSGERALAGDTADGRAARDHLVQYPLRAAAAALARESGFRGPVLTVSTACASGTDAIGIALRAIRSGKAEAVVAGGVDPVSEFSFSGFSALKALTASAVRPFSRDRDGLALGEGAAFLVLERERAAERRGARILALLAGYAATSDANHLTAPRRDGLGLAAAAAGALRDASCGPRDVDYVNAHGTGTAYNDRMETRALKEVLGARLPSVPVSSIKAVLGHSFGAAGAMEAAACVLAIRHGVAPPTANFTERDPECDIDCVPNVARRLRVDLAVSLSAGFGGQNAALVVRGSER